MHRLTARPDASVRQGVALPNALEMTVSSPPTAPTECLLATVYQTNVGTTWHHHTSWPWAVERAPVRGLHRPTVWAPRCSWKLC